MAGSVNKVILVGNLGRDPEVRATQDGRELANLAIATSESWKDRNSGERKERTEWHRVVIFNEGLVGIAKNYLRKGSKVYIEGQLATRKWTDKDGAEKYSTEVVLQGYNSSLTILDSKREDGGSAGSSSYDDGYSSYGSSSSSASTQNSRSAAPVPELDDEIPF
jgi:single-strand DNA-binding protein